MRNIFFLVCFSFPAQTLFAQTPDNLKLKDFHPQSIYKTPQSNIAKPRFTVIDMHAHAYAETQEDIATWVKNMDEFGVQKTILLTYAVGHTFDSLQQVYGKFPGRFELWCGIDFRGYNEPGWSGKAVKEIQRCYKMGARGIGEIHDKGMGLRSGLDDHETKVTQGMRTDDPRMKPIYACCAQLGIPISIHIAEPKWMYEPMDSTNDGLMNAYTWRVDVTRPGMFNRDELIQHFENAVRDNPQTIFVVCHLMNCEYDLSILGNLFDKYPNLYADIAARYSEISPVPVYTRTFFEKYKDHIVFGTDMGFDENMYKICWRILESKDEHFYETEQFGYHWPLYGLDLPDDVLKKLYFENALKIEKQ
jgi:predicted TIM-barrel fold metal-dependent hydrolase